MLSSTFLRKVPLGAIALAVVMTLAAQEARVPVIVELFTSEGCSSCPPADRLVARLDETQPVPGVQAIAMEEHVDYWNQLGWTDPFSSAQFSERQNDYARFLGGDGVYTPQMVVDGLVGFTGGDSAAAYREIQRAAKNQSARVNLRPVAGGRDPRGVELAVEVRAEREGERADVYLWVTESNLSSDVGRGENAGHTLRHGPVVRSFEIIGAIDARKSGTSNWTRKVRLLAEWKRENLRAVVFVQERKSRRITGAAAASIEPSTPSL
jgi:hypothetical protein